MVLLIAALVGNRQKEKQNRQKLQAPGEILEVNGERMHLLIKGDRQADEVLVYMAGGGVYSPVFDAKKLTDRLAKKHCVVILEKKGYGYSDFTDKPRDIATLLSETRGALNAAGLSGPFFLLPHSMSGLEALYWAQKYPTEVKGIIGLDPAVPQCYEKLSLQNASRMLKLTRSLLWLGLGKLLRIHHYVTSDKLQNLQLTPAETQQNRFLLYRNYGNSVVVREADNISQNLLEIAKRPQPDTVPMHFFISNGKGTSIAPAQWRSCLQTYLTDRPLGSFSVLECSHMLHNFEDKFIAESSLAFIAQLDSAKSV